MADRIIPLLCPSCGCPGSRGLAERNFGGEIKCDHCGVTSVLVIENQWHAKKADEYVCRHCGRLARPNDKFCECSAALTRNCAICKTSFFVGKEICPSCGWNHRIDLTSGATQIEFANKLRDAYREENVEGIKDALKVLAVLIGKARRVDPTAETLIKQVAGIALDLMECGDSFFAWQLRDCIWFLGSSEDESRELTQWLVNRRNEAREYLGQIREVTRNLDSNVRDLDRKIGEVAKGKGPAKGVVGSTRVVWALACMSFFGLRACTDDFLKPLNHVYGETHPPFYGVIVETIIIGITAYFALVKVADFILKLWVRRLSKQKAQVEVRKAKLLKLRDQFVARGKAAGA